MRTFAKWIALLIAVTAAWAAPVAAPKDSRIALRYGDGKILIVGGAIDTTNGTPTTGSQLDAAEAMGGALLSVASQQLLQNLKINPQTNWRIGDRWQLYPGAGPPVTLVIEKIAIAGHPECGCSWDGAIARFLSSAAANRIAGLRAGEFLVFPEAGVADVSQIPLIPLGQFSQLESEIQEVLFNRGREIVKDGNWGMEDNPNVTEAERDRVRNINRSFLSAQKYNIRVHAQRWALPGRKPLILVLALWYTDAGEQKIPVFAAEAILEQSGPSLKILSFEYRESEWMRSSEFATWTWDFDSLSRFLNAWRIGSRYFVLRQTNGYESSGVALQELDLNAGMLPTDLGYAFGQ